MTSISKLTNAKNFKCLWTIIKLHRLIGIVGHHSW
jgi:hypothetical protein